MTTFPPMTMESPLPAIAPPAKHRRRQAQKLSPWWKQRGWWCSCAIHLAVGAVLTCVVCGPAKVVRDECLPMASASWIAPLPAMTPSITEHSDSTVSPADEVEASPDSELVTPVAQSECAHDEDVDLIADNNLPSTLTVSEPTCTVFTALAAPKHTVANAGTSSEPAASPDAQQLSASSLSWSPTVLSRIEPVYPRSARRLGQEGRVRLALQVAPDGSVADARVTTSSGFNALDEAAVAAVRLWRFVERPAGFAEPSLHMELTVEFRLQG